VTIGIFSIISVFTLVDSLKSGIEESFDILNDDVLFIQQMPWGPEEGDTEFKWWEFIRRKQPALKDASNLQKRLTKADAVAFATGTSGVAEYKNSSYGSAEIAGVSFEYNEVIKLDIAQGRYFTEVESDGGRNTVIIGNEIAETLFGNLNPIGKSIKVKGHKVKVIGVFSKEGTSIIGSPFDKLVLMPVKLIARMVDVRNTDCQILVKSKPGVSNAELKDEIIGQFRAIRKLSIKKKNDFSVNEASMLSALVDGVFAMINAVGFIIGFFAILVGGFSIANIMFVSVKERTNIIGIQKALGAKNSFIMLQFLAESIVLCVFGGIVGLILMSILVLIVNMWSDSFTLVIFWSNLVIGVVISAVIGLVSGILPAYTASRLNPVDAIRSK
jgi:putative ABC transport system permease protein|tara:strand:- start:484 stop:1641 length:1158 start_codon:yes stop_codon:yes gene_type:complete